MSATLPNLTLLAGWLDADLYQTDFRPVPLSEHIKIGNKMFDSSFNVVREIRPEVKIQVSQKKKKNMRKLIRILGSLLLSYTVC
jgi:replicative superfamily II helicase